MGTHFNHCPNCHEKVKGGLLGGSFFKIYECKKCGTCYCHNCGGNPMRCPNCAATEKREVGEVRA